jgi:histone deacetylase HOS3
MNSLHGVGGVTPPRSSSSRRSSSAHIINGHPAPTMGKSPLSGMDDLPSATPPITAALIATAHFKAELDAQSHDVDWRPAETIVILHDSCYGHRYSRPRTSRAGLSTIVERPERIHASVLGVSMAYVRLGQRHAEGRYHPHPKKDARDIPTIPFRIRKTTRKLALSAPAVTNVHGTKWMEELKIMCDGAEAKLAMNGKELTRPDMTRSPDQEPPPKLHEGDLYLCSESLDAMEGALGAVCEGVDAVFQGSANGTGPKRAFVAIRPPGHHCSASYPSGFCWLNNVHVGIAHAALNHGLTHAAIIDFDLHHGDGSQSITWEHNTRSLNLSKNAPSWKKTSIGYFSLHDINSYPCEMGDEEKIKNASLCIENAHGQSIWNVHLQPWKNEHEFWDLYESRYSILLEKTRAYLSSHTQRLRSTPNQPQPKAAIFLSAGFDASEWESSGMQRHKVNVPTEFYARLTRDVVKLAAEEGCAVQGRIISVLEGGYSDRALSSGVLSHISGLAGGDPVQVKKEIEQNGLGYEMAQKVGAFQVKSEAPNGSAKELKQPYDPSWWALSQLEQLDALVNPPPPPAEPKKSKDASTPTYSSPTQSFIGKIVTAPKTRRSSSNLNGGSPHPASRPPSPPPPEVNWATAAHELSKLLIPSDRQTTSCRPEELSAEASRARRDRQSIITPAPPTGPNPANAVQTARMALRERKATKPLSTAKEEEEADKPVSKANRRKTVAGDAILAAEKVSINNHLKVEIR